MHGRNQHRIVIILQLKIKLNYKLKNTLKGKKKQKKSVNAFAPPAIWVSFVKLPPHKMWALEGHLRIIRPVPSRREKEHSEKLAQVTKPVCDRNAF